MFRITSQLKLCRETIIDNEKRVFRNILNWFHAFLWLNKIINYWWKIITTDQLVLSHSLKWMRLEFTILNLEKVVAPVVAMVMVVVEEKIYIIIIVVIIHQSIGIHLTTRSGKRRMRNKKQDNIKIQKNYTIGVV